MRREIPAFTLASGRSCQGQVFFAKVSQLDTNTYPGVVAAAVCFSGTRFKLQTLGDPIKPRLEISRGADGGVHITVMGERNRYYTVEASDGLSSDGVSWMPWGGGYADSDIDGFTGRFELDDSAPVWGGGRFFRAIEGYSFGGP